MPSASDVVEEIEQNLGPIGGRTCFLQFDSIIDIAISMLDAKTVLEIGSGRRPLMPSRSVASYVISDIDEDELRLADTSYSRRLLIDIAGRLDDDSSIDADLLFSRSVLEHVDSGRRAFENTRLLLREGGVAIHFFPTLYSPPFVLNRLLPERLADRVLRLVAPRDRTAHPKFPARYSWCRSTKRMEVKIRALGFTSVTLVPIWEFEYLERVPVLGAMARQICALFRRWNMRLFSAYALAVLER
ncbi:MAG: hypothetical protein ACR2LQ_08710 [Acidimicrobiales bacterium]